MKPEPSTDAVEFQIGEIVSLKVAVDTDCPVIGCVTAIIFRKHSVEYRVTWDELTTGEYEDFELVHREGQNAL